MTEASSAHVLNAFGQPVGLDLKGWQGCSFPPHEALAGRWCRLEPLSAARHGDALFDAAAADATGASWTYLPYGPFESRPAYLGWLTGMAGKTDPQFFAILNAQGQAVGVAAYMRIDPANGVLEIGHLHFSPALQRTVAATEAIALLIRRAFELGYRRVEWKCDALNAPSRRAAARFGFRFEGLFRQAVVIKGRNRDTAWFSIVDHEWPRVRAAFDAWLMPDNFDADGRQRAPLAAAASVSS